MNQKTILRSVLIAVLSLVATAATAHDFEFDGIFYKYNGDGTVSVTFKGSTFDDEYTDEYAGDVDIPSSVKFQGTTYIVTSIGDHAFYRMIGLTSVTIPNTVTSIGDYAFYYCSGLTSVTIPNSVSSIGNSAFNNCSGLTSVTIPNSVTSIGAQAFSSCSLTSVTIPNSVISIGMNAFSSCSGLTSVTIPNSVTSIDDNAFLGCSGLTSIIVDSENKTFDSRENCNAIIKTATNTLLTGCKNTIIPNSVTSIGVRAFYGCSGLTSITIPNSVTSIGMYAFYYCSGLTSVISKAVTPPTCGSSAFSTATYSGRLIVPSIAKAAYTKASIWSNFSNYAEPDNKITAIAINNNEANLVINNTLQLSATVTPEDATFADVLQWTSSNPEVATVDDNGLVTAIAKGDAEIKVMTCDGSNLSASCTIKVALPTAYNFEVGGIYYKFNGKGTVEVTFKGSSYYEYADEYTGDVVIPPSVTDPLSGTTYSVTSIGGYAFASCSGLTSVTIPDSVTSIGIFAFASCSGLTSVTIPDSVTSIGNYAFNASGLKSVTIGNSVKSIGQFAFMHCGGLTSVTIPNSVTSIGSDAFKYCSGLTSVTIPNSVSYISSCAFHGCSRLTSVTIPNSVISIGHAAFLDCSGLTSVTIPNSVKSIDNKAFQGCSGLTSVSIPNSVKSIGEYAFDGCSGLTSITIGNSVTSIGGYAFANSGLTSVTIPNSVNSIGEYAFSGCNGLTSFTIGNSVTSIGKYAFDGCSGLTSITIGNSFTSIGGYVFANSGLTSVTIPNTVTSISDYAFSGCSGLTSVTIGNSVTSIGKYAFWDCSGLTSIIVDSENQIYDSRENCNAIIEKASNKLLYGCKNTIIPNSVTEIGDHAFFGCSGLTSVTIPNSVTSISNFAFSGCSGLTRVDISSIEAWLGIKFSSQDSNPLCYAKHLYFNGEEVKDLVIPNSVTSIGHYAFYNCSGLTSVTIGNSVTSIGWGAFYGCSVLTSVISKAVTPPTCGGDAFSRYSATLIVPSVAKDAYKAKSPWSNFSNYAEPERKITAMEFGASTFGVENGETLQLTATVTPEDATFADVLQWTSSNPKVATVDNKGLVTTLAPGSTVIKATSCDGSNISATCTVVVCQKAANVNDLVEGANIVGFGLQGVKMHNGVLYACTTTESVNMSTPTFHGNNANNMAPYEDRNFAEFDQRDWVAIRGLEGDFEGKELSYPFVATFADGVLTPSEIISATADATTYNLNTFRAENILHGGYSNYADGDYKAYYVPVGVNEVAKFMGLIETIGGVKYLYSNNTYGRKDGEGIKVEGTIEDNSKVYSLLEGILVADKSTKAGVKIIMLDYLGQATGVEGVDSAAARIYTANGNIIIAATEDGEAAVYDYTGRLIKSVPVVAGDNTAVPVMPGCYIVRTGVKTQSVVVK